MSNAESLGSTEPIHELKRRVSRFRHETMGLDEDDNVGNNLAILRHARALVEEQINSSPEDESTSRLVHLKEKLSRQIHDLEVEATPEERSGGLRKTKSVEVASALVGASLIGLAIYLSAKDRGQANNARTLNFS
jgi:hypothetical protein